MRFDNATGFLVALWQPALFSSNSWTNLLASPVIIGTVIGFVDEGVSGMTTATLVWVIITGGVSVPFGNPGDAQETAIIIHNRDRITAIFRLQKAHNFPSPFRLFVPGGLLDQGRPLRVNCKCDPRLDYAEMHFGCQMVIVKQAKPITIPGSGLCAIQNDPLGQPSILPPKRTLLKRALKLGAKYSNLYC